MIKVRVGGVPEHFNLAWHLAIEKGIFKKNNIDIEWVDVPGGTGAMCKALRNNELDLTIALTEGIVSDIMAGNPSKLVQFYVNSPLRWGIFVKSSGPIKHVSEMPGHKYAISRFGSGSHLMARVNAHTLGFAINDSDFVVVKDLEGARKAIESGEAQLFMWEKFTTKPLVDNGEFRMIGECNTPWPCFVIAATDKFIAESPNILNCVLNIINHSCMMLKNDAQAPEMIVKRYGIKHEDALQWFRELEYACHPEMNEGELHLILWRLRKYGIISDIPSLDTVIYAHHLELINGVMIE